MNASPKWRGALGAATLLAVGFTPVGGQVPPPEAETLPPSTNPTERVIYPSEGQSQEQQLSDQSECYHWSTQQTQWDPHRAHDALEEKYGDALRQVEESQGGLLRGGARGALAGLAIGAIAGDAGKGAAIGAVAGGLTGGMRSRRQRDSAQAEFERDLQVFQKDLQQWDRNYVACMQARKYVVN